MIVYDRPQQSMYQSMALTLMRHVGSGTLLKARSIELDFEFHGHWLVSRRIHLGFHLDQGAARKEPRKEKIFQGFAVDIVVLPDCFAHGAHEPRPSPNFFKAAEKETAGTTAPRTGYANAARRLLNYLAKRQARTKAGQG